MNLGHYDNVPPCPLDMLQQAKKRAETMRQLRKSTAPPKKQKWYLEILWDVAPEGPKRVG